MDRSIAAIRARWGNVSKSVVRRLLTLDDGDLVRGDILALLTEIDRLRPVRQDDYDDLFPVSLSQNNGESLLLDRHHDVLATFDEATEQADMQRIVGAINHLAAQQAKVIKLEAQVADMERVNNELRTEMKALERDLVVYRQMQEDVRDDVEQARRGGA